MGPEDIRYKAGNSSTAEFALLGGVAQVNETIMLVADYLNNCIRQYDMVTDNITEFIGSCEGTPLQSIKILPGQEVPANTHFLSGPLKIVMIKSQNYLIVIDHVYQLITRYSFEKKTVRLLGDQLLDSLPNPRDILPTSDESAIYVVHSHGLSRVDLSTLEVTLLTGEVSSSVNNIDFSPGSFDTAVIGFIETIRWLVPDRLMVTIGTRLNEELIFIDLNEKEIYSTCIGSEDNNQTVIGPPGTCKLNAPTSLLVTRDRQIYIAGLTNVKYNNYGFNTSSSIFHMKAYGKRLL
ncbi:hypothetical protein EB796_020453 [Bugula neritina]|uniref:Uncharacterized protein n=1 Tax=Bugula neritina TaxID=10212 RepID=A0A7J7J555_BUGNE|nr:hypothetical protein EB796_020453 [Bugula neritina]